VPRGEHGALALRVAAGVYVELGVTASLAAFAEKRVFVLLSTDNAPLLGP